MKHPFHIKNKLVKGAVLLLVILMFLFPFAAYEGASTGLLLWFHNVLPNLLPFIILSNLIIRLDITRQISKIFYPLLGKIFKVSSNGCYPIVLGYLSGIPMGAKSTADLVSEDKISLEEGQFLYSMCNNASPMFIIGYIAITQLKLPQIKYALFFILYASAMISALFCRTFYQRFLNKKSNRKLKLQANSLEISLSKKASSHIQREAGSNRFSFDIVDEAITNGFEVITKIGGYIILFSIMAQIVKEAIPNMNYLKAFLMGILEITTGISQISKSGMETETKIVLVAALTSFGGFSGMAQTKSVVGNTRLSIKYYFVVKLISAIVALLLTLLYVTLFDII
jgi:sporulation integral membrane protein YlbJ